MNYQQIDSFMRKTGLVKEPAFDKLNIMMSPIPKMGETRILGLYYPEGSKSDPDFGYLPVSTTIIPGDADYHTLLHELGHCYKWYHDGDLSENSAENWRQSHEYLLNGGKIAMKTAVRAAQTATISITPNSMFVGGTVNVYLSGFHPDALVVVYIINGGELYAWMDSSGAAAYSFVDNDAPGDYTIKAYDDFGNSATTTFILKPVITPDYTLIQDTLYPDAAMYDGNAQVGVFSFTAPLTVIPGIDWLVQNMIGAFVNAANDNGATMLELQVYSKPGVFGSTDYIVSFAVKSDIVMAYKGAVGLGTVAIVAIIAGVIAALLITAYVVRQIYNIKWGGTVKTTTTTTTQAQTITLNPGQSLVNTAAGIQVTAGSGGATVTSLDGTTTNITAGSLYVTKTGDSITASSDNNGTNPTHITIPANTTNSTYSGPAAATPGGATTTTPTDWTKIAKYAAIGIGALAGVVLITNVTSLFKKV